MASPVDHVFNDSMEKQVALSCFDFLLIELVPMAERLAREYEESSDHPEMPDEATTDEAQQSNYVSAKTYDGLPETKIFKDSLHLRLETLGFRVGLGLAEKLSVGKLRFESDLDIIKFLCKEVWVVVFKKQIDNLKTNHRGVYVLTDAKFRPFVRMSMATTQQAVLRAQPHLIFPCGIIRGVLDSLGVKATIQAEATELPGVVFQVKSVQEKKAAG